MAAYRRVYDSRHLQADCQEPGSAADSGTLRSAIEYGLPLPFLLHAVPRVIPIEYRLSNLELSGVHNAAAPVINTTSHCRPLLGGMSRAYVYISCSEISSCPRGAHFTFTFTCR